jgi:hypothetical protein
VVEPENENIMILSIVCQNDDVRGEEFLVAMAFLFHVILGS